MLEAETSRDAWLGGRLVLTQPKRGHRVGSDAALLAAAAFGEPRRIIDVGAGVGAVGLALALRWPQAMVTLAEIDPELAALGARNAADNGLAGSVGAAVCDVTDAKARRAAGLADSGADLVVTNPPYYEAPRAQASPDLGRARAHVLPRGLAPEAAMMAWFRACTALLAPRGRLVLVHRPDRLFDLASALEERVGALRVLPVHPRAGGVAHRMLVTGVLGAKTPPSIAPGLVLHGADGAFTPQADALHRGDAVLDWG